jgi:chloramphenicol 3-O phosphotransferase
LLQYCRSQALPAQRRRHDEIDPADRAPAVSGRVVILNGAPRAGTSTIAAAMQTQLGGHWINFGVDRYNAMMPPALLPGIGLRPGGERPDLEPFLPGLYYALYDGLKALSRQGFDVVADLGHHDSYSRPLGILPACARRMAGEDLFFVGVHCSLDVIMARRNADPQGGFYASGTQVPAPVQRWQDSVHLPGIYDLEVDGGTQSPQACVAAIGAMLAAPPPVRAFAQLAAL